MLDALVTTSTTACFGCRVRRSCRGSHCCLQYAWLCGGGQGEPVYNNSCMHARTSDWQTDRCMHRMMHYLISKQGCSPAWANPSAKLLDCGSGTCITIVADASFQCKRHHISWQILASIARFSQLSRISMMLTCFVCDDMPTFGKEKGEACPASTEGHVRTSHDPGLSGTSSSSISMAA